MSRPGRAPVAAVSHRWAAAAAVALSFCGGLLSGPAAESAEDTAQLRPNRVLFDTILSDLLEPGRVDLASLPPEVRPRADEFRRRAMAFRSLLPLAAQEPGPRLWASEKRQELERGIVALVDAPGIAEMARDYAKRAVLMYEWEGMGAGPLAEAAFAEQHLHANPDTPMEPYLTLFLAHRYRCAAEALEAEMKPEAAATTRATYLVWLDAAIRHSDPLVRYTAQDLAGRMRVYLPAPALPRRKAVELAIWFVAQNAVDVSGQQMSSVTLQVDRETGAPYWLVQWSWTQPRLGGEYGLRVYMDGRIKEARLGP